MGRTESKSMQVNPRDEQFTIDKMQKFGWTLLNSQDVKTIDNHLERKGDTIYQVTEKEQYVKLTFSRDLDLPNLDIIKTLETEYDSLVIEDEGSLFPIWCIGFVVVSFVLLLVSSGIGAIALIAAIGSWVYYYTQQYSPKKAKADQQRAKYPEKRERILAEVSQYL